MTIKFKASAFALFCAATAFSVTGQTLKSPDGDLTMKFSLTSKGEPQYELEFKGKEVVKPSRLGFEIKKTKQVKDGRHLKDASLVTAYTPFPRR